MTFTSEDILQAYKKAPEYIQDFVTLDEMKNAYNKIRTGHKLHLDQAEALSIAVNAVILDLAPLDTFPALMKEMLPTLADDERTKIVEEVNNTLFRALRDWVRLEKESPIKAEAPKPASPTPLATNLPKPEPPILQTPNLVAAPSVVAGKMANTVSQAPQEVKVAPPPQPAHPYVAGDPYHEPIE